MNSIEINDIRKFVEEFPFAKELQDSVFLITGATGLIGSSLVHNLLSLGRNIHIVAPVRNFDKADCIFNEDEHSSLTLIECDLLHFDYEKIGNVDYIIHCAAPTSSKFFIDNPVDTAETIYLGTQALLRYSSKHHIKGFVYLSSLEVYGSILDDSVSVTEDVQGYMDPTVVRSSYPMAKRAAENLCCAYAGQYGVPVRIARLTQTFGAGVSKQDNRVFAQFARSIINNADIVLHTTGESSKPYCYTTDGVSAILYILLKGADGESYNVANQDTYISVRQLAEFLRNNFNPKINVRVEEHSDMGYAPVTKLRLSSEKLMKLGWRPQYGLKEMFGNLIMSLGMDS